MIQISEKFDANIKRPVAFWIDHAIEWLENIAVGVWRIDGRCHATNGGGARGRTRGM